LGYIKRTPLSEYRTQSRGGRGAKGSSTRDEDFIEYMFVATNHNYILLFTEQGKCFWLRAFAIPEGNKTSKGRAIQNLLQIASGDRVKAFINVRTLEDDAYLDGHHIILCTRGGTIKKTSLRAYSRPRQSGINAITVNEGDQLLEARLTNGNNEIILAVRSGRAIRFHESKVRPMGRNAPACGVCRSTTATMRWWAWCAWTTPRPPSWWCRRTGTGSAPTWKITASPTAAAKA
jgi:DNA gyrase subunit A